MQQPLISVIVTTYNNQLTIEACLASISAQSYDNVELIVVDNHSTDETVPIAKRYTDAVYVFGPERSTQRNIGVSKASGEYVLIIDSDMELSEHVVRACVAKVQAEPELQALIIPEESFGKGFWAACKRLERSFYVGVDFMEAARFFNTALYRKLGGYNEQLISGEDWDLSQRFGAQAPIGRISEYIYHNEGHLRLYKLLKKKYYYAQKFAAYLSANKNQQAAGAQTSLLKRYALFFAHPSRLVKNPAISTGMLFMKTAEFVFGGLGFLTARMKGVPRRET